MLTIRRSTLFRSCALLLAVLHLLFMCTCSGKWNYVRNEGAVDYDQVMEGKHVRFTQDKKTWDLRVTRVEYPIVFGTEYGGASDKEVAVDLRLASSFEVFDDAQPAGRVTLVNYDETLKSKRVRFHAPEAIYDVHVKSIEYPFVMGTLHDDEDQHYKVDLRKITGMEVYSNGTTTVFVVLGIALVVVLVVLLIADATDDPEPAPPPSGESCPVLFVYDAQGPHRVGEAYAGAIFRSIQRNDLLPVPAMPGSTLRCQFVNPADETQYTDQLELFVVDHPEGTRAVSTIEQIPLLVGEPRAPLAARDTGGTDVTQTIAADDDALWQTDWDRVLAQEAPALKDGVEASFSLPRAGAKPVLELVLSNTYTLEYTVGHFFAMTGAGFDAHMAQWNQTENGPFVKSWLQREGVSMTVEQKQGGAWKHVAVIPPVGAMELRRVAVPLLEPARGDEREPVQVRVSGGTGFWQIDELTLSTQVAGTMDVRRVAPAMMVDVLGNDLRADVAGVDGTYQILANRGDRVAFDFEMPPLKRRSERSLFLFTNGYYNVHAPVSTGPSTVASVASREGGLAALGIDMLRELHQIALKTPPSAQAVTPVEP